MKLNFNSAAFLSTAGLFISLLTGCSSSVEGKYISKDNPNRYWELKSDGTWFSQGTYDKGAGDYSQDGNEIIFKSPLGMAEKATLNGSTLTFTQTSSSGRTYENVYYKEGTTPPIEQPESTSATDSNSSPKTTYVSSLSPTQMNNHRGPLELNMSNGEAEAKDGKPISLDGKKYTSGLGCHAPCEIKYDLARQYKHFISDIGIDDEVGDNGSARFEVWVDGEKVYEKEMKGTSSTETVNVDVSGKNELKLIVDPMGPESYDHVSWADARLTE
jgi:hypothetical protein